jgi:hypothetical protein
VINGIHIEYQLPLAGSHYKLRPNTEGRDKSFANKITGGVHEGKLASSVLYQYAAPSLSTVPLLLLIGVWVITFYEKLGANLAPCSVLNHGFCRGRVSLTCDDESSCTVLGCE